MNKKGGALKVWLGALVILFLVGVVYLGFSPAWDAIYGAITPMLSGAGLSTAQKIGNLWAMWPVILLIGVFVGIIIALNREDSGQGF